MWKLDENNKLVKEKGWGLIKQPLYIRVIYWLYKKYINKVYLPSGTYAKIQRYPKVFKEDAGKISAIFLKVSGDNQEVIMNYEDDKRIYDEI